MNVAAPSPPTDQPWGNHDDTLVTPSPVHADPTDALPLPAPAPLPPRQRRRPPWIVLPAVAIASAIISGTATWTLAPRTVTDVVQTTGPVTITTVASVSASSAPTTAATRARATKPASTARPKPTAAHRGQDERDDVRPALTTAPATRPPATTTATTAPPVTVPDLFEGEQ